MIIISIGFGVFVCWLIYVVVKSNGTATEKALMLSAIGGIIATIAPIFIH